jgi:hypothetical protein
VQFQVLRRAPFAGGEVFGDGGAYERIDALVRFAVDPGHAMNDGIDDLRLAPRDAAGCVHFESDVIVLRPLNRPPGGGNLLCSVVNRGRTALVPFSHPPRGFVPSISDQIEVGDAFLLRRGWTVALCGWQWDVIRRPGALGLDAPLAIEAGGHPAETTVTVRFQPLTARASEYLGHWPAHPGFRPDRMHHAYPAADLNDPAATLTVRDAPDDEPVAVARSRWRFARCDDGMEATWITVDGGFDAGRIYELRYRTTRCPAAGTGLLAIRDAVSFLRNGPASDGNPCAGEIAHTFAYGVSQTGRFLREFLHNGNNVDEAGRQVFDGMFVQIAGARRGEFNFRGAQPSSQYGSGKAQGPPWAYTPTSMCAESLVDRQRTRGGMPKVFEVNTANEYWRSDAMLVHADAATGSDLEIPEDVRIYMLAGCQHGPGVPFLTDRAPLTPEQRAANYLSILNYTPLTRAALMNLAAWVEHGTPPPGSQVPSIAHGTAVPRITALGAFEDLPGAGLPNPANLSNTLVPAVDGDGNDIPGIRLPEMAVPVASSAGWNVRHPETGGDGLLADMVGSTFPFAGTVAERQGMGDPRPAIDERYRGREHYCSLVREAANDLVVRRLLLAEDVERVVAGAGRLYDRVTAAK